MSNIWSPRGRIIRVDYVLATGIIEGPPDATGVWGFIIAGGAGGGSGACASGSPRGGGGGGSAGGVTVFEYLWLVGGSAVPGFGKVLDVTMGAAGTGGPTRTGVGDGNDGVDGGAVLIVVRATGDGLAYAAGGRHGSAGTSLGAGAGGVADIQQGEYENSPAIGAVSGITGTGGAGGYAGTGAAPNFLGIGGSSGLRLRNPAGGGGGGGVQLGTGGAGSDGGRGCISGCRLAGGTRGTAEGQAGTNGSSSPIHPGDSQSYLPTGGGGGGGGAGNSAGPGGDGGAGGTFGGGGGGGGAGTGATHSGVGGNGGPPLAKLVWSA